MIEIDVFIPTRHGEICAIVGVEQTSDDWYVVGAEVVACVVGADDVLRVLPHEMVRTLEGLVGPWVEQNPSQIEDVLSARTQSYAEDLLIARRI